MSAAVPLLALAAGLLLASCGNLLKSASEKAGKDACEQLSPTSGPSGNCEVGTSAAGATTTAAAAEPPMNTSDLPADWPAYLTPKTGTVKLVNASGEYATVVFRTKSMNARAMGEQAKAAGCSTNAGGEITVSDNVVRLDCAGRRVSITSGLGDLSVSFLSS